MKKIKFIGALAISLLLSSCSNDDDNGVSIGNLNLNLSGLENLGADFRYEGWLIVNGSPVSTGVFTVNDSGQLSATSFSVASITLNTATDFVLSIEPTVDPDPAPSNTKLLSGSFSGNTANVNSNLVADFSSASGKYILATPTDGTGNNELSGVWFLDNSSGSAMTGLSLPTLADGWKYEGWAVINGTPVSTGTFIDASIADDNASTSPFKGTMGNGPGYPGEDYIQNAPAGLTFPTNLQGATIVVSVEPYPDNSSAPFTLKPLAHMVPAMAADHTAIDMGAGPVSQLSGSVTR